MIGLTAFLALSVSVPHSPELFAKPPMDKPVLESIEQVYQARRTGVSVFDFDGVHYVVKNLPDEYVDYSARWIRLP